MKATITIPGFRCLARIGVPDEERAHPQQLALDLALEVEIAEAAAADDLEATVDYVAVHREVSRLIEERSWKLVETLAVDLGRRLLTKFPRIESIAVRIRKNIFPNTDPIEVSINLTRNES